MALDNEFPQSADLTPEEQWCAALDGRVIYVGDEARPIHVEGVHREGNELWIQLAPVSESDDGIVIHCWHGQSPDEILAYLRRQLKAGIRRHLIDAARS